MQFVPQIFTQGEYVMFENLTSEAQLRRSVLSCLLNENSFYESGASCTNRIKELVKQCDPYMVASLAIEARDKFHLRKIPLLLIRELARNTKTYTPSILSNTLNQIIQRPDEIIEFLKLYWSGSDKDSSLSAQVKKGISKAFNKFNEYQIAKWNKNDSGPGSVQLRDAAFLCHAKPENMTKGKMFAQLVNKDFFPTVTKAGFPIKAFYGEYSKLEIPDTWEVRLSSGENKKDVFEDLIKNNKLGAMALIKNIRGMIEAGLDKYTIIDALHKANVEKLFPFRFYTAYKNISDVDIKKELEDMMLKCVRTFNKLSGKTALLVDVSGSMTWATARKSETKRIDTATALAILLREVCDECVVYTFSDRLALVGNNYHGFELADSIINNQPNMGTALRTSLNDLKSKEEYDRVIVITDEQSTDGRALPSNNSKGYIMNIATYDSGLTYDKNWTLINGFSDHVIDFIYEYEHEEKNGWFTEVNDLIVKWARI